MKVQKTYVGVAVFGDPKTFEDSPYGWKYGTTSNGKITTYKFDNTMSNNVGTGHLGDPKNGKTTNTYNFKSPETFLNNLKQNKTGVDLSKYKVGQAVYHKKFGEGIIMKIEQEADDLKVEINFQKFGIKRLMAKYAGLEIL